MGRTDAKTEAKVIEMYCNNYTREDIATETGVSNPTISAILKRHGIEMRGKQLDDKTETKIIEMYRLNCNVKDIVDVTGVSSSTITSVVKRNGMQGRRLQLQDEQTVIDMYNNGYRVIDIACKVEVPMYKIYYILKKNGVERKIRDETVETVMNMYKSGCEICLISKKVDLSADVIQCVLSDNNVEKRRRNVGVRKIDDVTVDKIIRLYSDGYNLKSIAESVGVSNSAVSNILERKGIRRKRSVRKYKVTEDVEETLINMYKSGCTIKDISKELMISCSRIHALIAAKSIHRDKSKNR